MRRGLMWLASLLTLVLVSVRLVRRACDLLNRGCKRDSRYARLRDRDALGQPDGSHTPPEGCEARPGVARRMEDPNGPYGHQVVVAETKDGVTLTGA